MCVRVYFSAKSQLVWHRAETSVWIKTALSGCAESCPQVLDMPLLKMPLLFFFFSLVLDFSSLRIQVLNSWNNKVCLLFLRIHVLSSEMHTPDFNWSYSLWTKCRNFPTLLSYFPLVMHSFFLIFFSINTNIIIMFVDKQIRCQASTTDSLRNCGPQGSKAGLKQWFSLRWCMETFEC